MTDAEITTLAREYAEVGNPISDYEENNNMEYRDADLDMCKGYAESVIRWLCERYCLVEKEKLRAIRWRKAYSAEDIRSKFTEECLIDALFPDLGKEVKS